MSIPGIGYITAITILAEIGGIDKFVTPKQLVAFFGVDPAVNESGKFKGDRMKMSKRGTRLGRRALYAVALASIRTKRNGEAMNVDFISYPSVVRVYHHSLIFYIFGGRREIKPLSESPKTETSPSAASDLTFPLLHAR